MGTQPAMKHAPFISPVDTSLSYTSPRTRQLHRTKCSRLYNFTINQRLILYVDDTQRFYARISAPGDEAFKVFFGILTALSFLSFFCSSEISFGYPDQPGTGYPMGGSLLSNLERVSCIRLYLYTISFSIIYFLPSD